MRSHVKITRQWKSITRQWKSTARKLYTRGDQLLLLRTIFHTLPLFYCKFSARTHVSFTRVNKIETMYGRSRVNVKVEPRSSFTFKRVLSYIAFILFTRVHTLKLRESTKKLRDSGNQPLERLSTIFTANSCFP